MFFFSPIRISAFYILIRPLVQPFGTLRYDLFNNIPLTSIFSILLIASAYTNGFLKKDNALRLPPIFPLYLMLFFSVISFIWGLPHDSIGGRSGRVAGPLRGAGSQVTRKLTLNEIHH